MWGPAVNLREREKKMAARFLETERLRAMWLMSPISEQGAWTRFNESFQDLEKLRDDYRVTYTAAVRGD